MTRHEALPPAQIRAVETDACPHAAIREDISPNLMALEDRMTVVRPELLLVESGGDNLAAQYSRELQRDAQAMRDTGPTVFAQVTCGVGVPEIARHIESARALALGG